MEKIWILNANGIYEEITEMENALREAARKRFTLPDPPPSEEPVDPIVQKVLDNIEELEIDSKLHNDSSS